MRLAIFGVPRSGTSLLYTTIAPHFQYSLNEPFPPKSSNILVEKDGKLQNQYDHSANDDAPTQSRDERLILLRDHGDQEYFIKVFPHDLAYFPIFDWMMRVRYRFITVERKRPIDAIISAIIAYQSKIWIVRQGEKVPELESPIVFDDSMAHYMIHSYRTYYEFVHNGPVQAIHKNVYYEDLANMKTRGEILDAVGLSKLINVDTQDDRLPRTAKPRTEQEKRKLIANMPKLVDWYEQKMMPILPERAKRFDLDEYRV